MASEDSYSRLMPERNRQATHPQRFQRIQLLEQGFAHILDTTVRAFERPGFVLTVTSRRDVPEWADWITPIWLLSMNGVTICSTSARYAQSITRVFGNQHMDSLLDPALLEAGRRIHDRDYWRCFEVYSYLKPHPPIVETPYRVDRLGRDAPHTGKVFYNFDGDVFAIRDEEERLLSYSGVKNKGIIQEIAVLTENPNHRGKAMGMAVTARATLEIMSRGLIPVYIPNRLDNFASYKLAEKLGFEKVGEMLNLSYRESKWTGYNL